MKPRRALLSMVMCLALLALLISPIVPVLAQTGPEVNLEGAENFRDMGGYLVGQIEPGVIYRCGHLAGLTESDAAYLFDTLGIKTVIDFRTDTDKMRDGIDFDVCYETFEPVLPKESWLLDTPLDDSGFPFVGEGDAPQHGTLNPDNEDTWNGHDSLWGYDDNGVTHEEIMFTQGGVSPVVWDPPGFEDGDMLLNNILLWNLSEGMAADKDFDQWYVNVAENNQAAIASVFAILADSDNYPIAFHCTQGKDRVGTVSALLQSLLGVPPAAIIADYALTYELTKTKVDQTLMALEFLVRPHDDLGHLIADLPPEFFQKSLGVHVPAMEALLAHLAGEGGVAAYLTAIDGIDETMLNSIIDNISGFEEASAGEGPDVQAFVSFPDIGTVSVTFSNVDVAGDISVFRQSANPAGPLPAGVTIRGPFVDISTTATFTGTIEVELEYPEGTTNPDDLRLFHWHGTGWEDVTTSVDTDTNTIYGEVDSLSPFGYGHYTTTGVPAFLNIYIGIAAALAAGLAAYALRRRFVQQ